MDRIIDVAQVVDVVLDAGQCLSVFEQALHFGLRAAVAQFQIIKELVLAFCKALVRRLHRAYVRAHLDGVVRHVHDCGVCSLYGGHSIAAIGLFQRSAETDGLLCVVIGGDPGLRGVLGKVFRLVCRISVDRLQTAEALLQVTACRKRVFEDLPDACGDNDFFEP